ncbi:PREDICTED: KIF1-binding protein homolog [Dinoponera quadriceps]|uniref:KIF-binding protein n=1 Tax=Dinoponera quadriceps TaxID=609295 RepID=A0A6P3XAG5_DINQU|nr:PREDICTED: KIF1-binding protein homolog [Dinoponera quadriceps]
MSTNESTSEQGCKSTESASGTTAELSENAGNIEGFTMNISEEFVEIYKSSINLAKAANTIVQDFSRRLDILYQSIINAEDANPDEVATLADAYLFLSNLYIFESTKKEITLAELAITKCIELLKRRELGHKFILTAVNAYYNLGVLYNEQNKQELSMMVYNTAFELYSTYIKEEIYPAPLYIASYLGLVNVDPQDLLDKRSIIVMQALLIGYGNLDKNTEADRIHMEKIAICQHEILNKKLNSTLLLATDYNMWLLIALTLSQYFVTRNRFTEARDHLAVASLMAKLFYEKAYMKMDESENASKKAFLYDMYQQISADIAIYWARYGIQLLRSSQERILNGIENKLCAVCNLTTLSIVTSSEDESNKLLIFADEKNDLQEFTATITDKYFSSYTEALVIFENVMKYLNEAKMYYNNKCINYNVEKHLKSYVWTTLLISQGIRNK